MVHARTLEAEWARLSRQFPVLLLTGPRQVGKTTFLEAVATRGRRHVTLDDPALRAAAASDPVLFLERFPPPLLIDEVQYAPQLFPVIKLMVDRARKPGLFWLTGSQHFHAMKGVSETLAGRVGIVNMLGFSSRERRGLPLNVPPFVPTLRNVRARAASAAPLGLSAVYRDIFLGGFPALATGAVKNRELFFRSYVQTYLQRDVRDLTQVGDEAAFLRFVRACAARTAQLLNLSDLARDADVSVNTAKQWLSILQGSGQVMLLPPYHTNVTKRLVKAPKLYFLDTGLCAYLTDWSSPRTLEAGAMNGAVLETHVVAEIVKSWWHRAKATQLFYFRDRDGREIDLLIVQDRKFLPVEIKKSAQPRADHAAAFDALRRLPGEVGEGAVVCFVRDVLPVKPKVWAVPIGII